MKWYLQIVAMTRLYFWFHATESNFNQKWGTDFHMSGPLYSSSEMCGTVIIISLKYDME